MLGQFDVSVGTYFPYPHHSLGTTATLPCFSQHDMLYNRQLTNRSFDASSSFDSFELYPNYWIKKMRDMLNQYELVQPTLNVIDLEVRSEGGFCGGSICCLRVYHHRAIITMGETYNDLQPRTP
jgi:hypothetical protein